MLAKKKGKGSMTVLEATSNFMTAVKNQSEQRPGEIQELIDFLEDESCGGEIIGIGGGAVILTDAFTNLLETVLKDRAETIDLAKLLKLARRTGREIEKLAAQVDEMKGVIA